VRERQQNLWAISERLRTVLRPKNVSWRLEGIWGFWGETMRFLLTVTGKEEAEREKAPVIMLRNFSANKSGLLNSQRMSMLDVGPQGDGFCEVVNS
jgi:hypothetical protein